MIHADRAAPAPTGWDGFASAGLALPLVVYATPALFVEVGAWGLAPMAVSAALFTAWGARPIDVTPRRAAALRILRLWTAGAAVGAGGIVALLAGVAAYAAAIVQPTLAAPVGMLVAGGLFAAGWVTTLPTPPWSLWSPHEAAIGDWVWLSLAWGAAIAALPAISQVPRAPGTDRGPWAALGLSGLTSAGVAAVIGARYEVIGPAALTQLDPWLAAGAAVAVGSAWAPKREGRLADLLEFVVVAAWFLAWGPALAAAWWSLGVLAVPVIAAWGPGRWPARSAVVAGLIGAVAACLAAPNAALTSPVAVGAGLTAGAAVWYLGMSTRPNVEAR